VRFIPACAGNIHKQYPLCQDPPVHPRVCGEHFLNSGSANFHIGSSPRVRGTYLLLLQLFQPLRFIPACAGNISLARSCRRRDPVHPRVCGEHRVGMIMTVFLIGSSPRVRGTSVLGKSTIGIWRFIPACAGNIPHRCGIRSRRPVHPRVCGEHPGVLRKNLPLSGSSPRVRGT